MRRGLLKKDKIKDKLKRSSIKDIAAVNKNNQEKAYTFLDAIDKYAFEQREKIKNDAKAVKEQEIEKAETEVLNDIYNMIQDKMAKMKAEIIGQISKKEMACKNSLLKNREQISKEVFNGVKDKIVEFTQTEEYIKLLEKLAQNMAKVLTNSGTKLYINPADIKFSPILEKAFEGKGCLIETDESIKLGGIRGYNAKMGVVIDETLDSKLEAQRDWFKEHSGLTVV